MAAAGRIKRSAKPSVCTTRTVEHVRQAFVLEGFEAALVRKKRVTPTPKLLDGRRRGETDRHAVRKTVRVAGHWSLRLLADQLVELEVVDSINPKNSPHGAQKNGTTRRKIEYWVIPPEADCRVRRGNGRRVGDLRKRLTIRTAPWCAWTSNFGPTHRWNPCTTPATKNHPRAAWITNTSVGDGQYLLVCRATRVAPSGDGSQKRRTKMDWAYEVSLPAGHPLMRNAPRSSWYVTTSTRTPGVPSTAKPLPRRRLRSINRQQSTSSTRPSMSDWLNVAECELRLPDPAISDGPPHRRLVDAQAENRGMSSSDQRQTTSRRLAIHHREGSCKTEQALPERASLDEALALLRSSAPNRTFDGCPSNSSKTLPAFHTHSRQGHAWPRSLPPPNNWPRLHQCPRGSCRRCR